MLREVLGRERVMSTHGEMRVRPACGVVGTLTGLGDHGVVMLVLCLERVRRSRDKEEARPAPEESPERMMREGRMDECIDE